MTTPAELVRDITAGYKNMIDHVADLRERIEAYEAKGDRPPGGSRPRLLARCAAAPVRGLSNTARYIARLGARGARDHRGRPAP